MNKTYEIIIEKQDTPAKTQEFTIPMSPITPAELLPPLYRLFDTIVALETGDEVISCGKGCGDCCSQLVPVAIPEIFYLKDLVASFPPAREKAVKKKFFAIFKTVEEQGLLEALKNPADYRDIDKKYFALNQKCPFLENKSCSIYADRPFVCREYLVVSPSERCGDPYNRAINKVINKIEIKRNMGPLMTVFAARLYAVPKEPIPLPLALNRAKRSDHIYHKKWPGAWMFESFLNAVTALNDEKIKILINLKET
ncbi:MAG: YkgJ family cysteine cluster protein [bacterium]|nr:YkgJ family cysteine cluster protein [bacterium]